MWVARPILRRLIPHADDLIAAYRAQDPRARGGVILSRILGDLAFRAPARDYAAAHQGHTFFYEFDWDSPASGGRLGAAHGTDLGFVFDTLASVTGRHGIVGQNPPQELADRVHRIWLQFATYGRAPWAEYDGRTRLVHRLAEGTTVSEEPLLVSVEAETSPISSETR
jgi:para-nitrobenzyl esterase